MGIHADELTTPGLVRLLGDTEAAVQRQACESLARSATRRNSKTCYHCWSLPIDLWRTRLRSAARQLPDAELREAALKTDSHRAFLQGSLALLSVSPDRSTAEAIIRRGQQHMQGFVPDPEFLDMLRLFELCLIRGQLQSGGRAELADEARR